MTIRITVSLPDEIHADLVRIAESSNISASAVVRALLSEVVPKMTGVLDYLGTITPAEAAPMVAELDAWAGDFKTLLEDAPPGLAGFRKALGPFKEDES